MRSPRLNHCCGYPRAYPEVFRKKTRVLIRWEKAVGKKLHYAFLALRIKSRSGMDTPLTETESSFG